MPFVSWSHYNKTIRVAEILASVYFMLDLVLSFTLKVVSSHNYFYWAFSLLFGVFVSSFCFSDYIVSNEYGNINLNDEPALMKRKELSYWNFFFGYLGLNLLTGFLHYLSQELILALFKTIVKALALMHLFFFSTSFFLFFHSFYFLELVLFFLIN